MARLPTIFAQNLKEKRRKCGFSQALLAEKVDVSTHHIAMIELARNFPTAGLMERIAEALNIEIYELFIEKNRSPNEDFRQLREDIKSDVYQLFNEFFIEKTNTEKLDPVNTESN